MTGPGPRVGVVVSHPIQYFSPLFDLISDRGRLRLSVRYGNDAGVRTQWDPGFNVNHQWDLDLVSGHHHEFATRGAVVSRARVARSLIGTARFVRAQDVLVIHGYVTIVAVTAIVLCWLLRRPYWLRSDSSVRLPHHRWSPRELWPRLAYRWSEGALATGRRNADVASSLGARSVPVAPFAVDNARFRDAGRAQEVAPRAPVVVFAGKFVRAKRPLDVLGAARLLPGVEFTMIGDGAMGEELRATAQGLPNVSFAGFKNQTEMPSALAGADVLVLPSDYEPWGLIVNEAMASGVVPVVSDAVGCAPDLVDGVGETYPSGDLEAMRTAIESGLATARESGTRDRLWERVERWSLLECAGVYERVLRQTASRRA